MAGYNHKTYELLIKRMLDLIIQHFGDELISCALFGSVARGEAQNHSDIDIIIVHKRRSRRPVEIFWKILSQLREDPEYKKLEERRFFPDPYPVFLDDTQLEENPWVLLDVIEDGIILFDRGNMLKKRLDYMKRRLGELRAKKVFLHDRTWYWDLKPDWKPGEVIRL